MANPAITAALILGMVIIANPSVISTPLLYTAGFTPAVGQGIAFCPPLLLKMLRD
jgi:hypothetical protein